jgi:hypothetical protein
VSDATAISEVNARAAINILMTYLHVAEKLSVPPDQDDNRISLACKGSVIVFLYGALPSPIANQ